MLLLLKQKLRSRSMTCSAQALFNTAKAPFPLMLFWSRRTIPIVFVWTIPIVMNALTAKSKFPVPIMDEFLDELLEQLGSQPWIFELGFTKSGWTHEISTKRHSKHIMATSSFV